MGRKARLPDFFIPPDQFAVLDTFVAKVSRAFGYCGCAVMFYDGQAGCLRFLASWGLPAEYEKWQTVATPDQLLNWVRDAVTPLTVNDVRRQPSARAFMLHPQGRAMIWFPLFATGSVIGALAAFHRERDAFRGSDFELMDLIANQAASIIELYLRLDEVTITDFLTGLRDGAYFEHRVREEVERSRRYEHPVSVVIVGVRQASSGDFFGVTSEMMGRVAERLKAVVRTADVLSRHNDSVFAALLPETPLAGGQATAEKLESEARAVLGVEAEAQILSKVVSFSGASEEAEEFVIEVQKQLALMGKPPGRPGRRRAKKGA